MASLAGSPVRVPEASVPANGKAALLKSLTFSFSSTIRRLADFCPIPGALVRTLRFSFIIARKNSAGASVDRIDRAALARFPLPKAAFQKASVHPFQENRKISEFHP